MAEAEETGAGSAFESGVSESERRRDGMWSADIDTMGKHGVRTGSGDSVSEV